MLYDFYGTECPHCVKMMPMVNELIKDGFEIQKMEVWHNEDNASLMSQFDRGLCGGVPFFYNTESKQFICGETDEATLRKWAEGKKV